VAASRSRKHPPAARPSVPTTPARCPNFELEFFVEDDGRPVVRDWLRSLSLTKKQVLGSAMGQVLQRLGIGVCATEFGKQLGQGLFEFRLRQKPGDVQNVKREKKLPPEEILMRVFCHAHGDRLVLLLGGYDNGEDPSPKRQNKEIEEARARLRRWKARQKKGLAAP
jgi:hypothetical protein